MRTRKATKVQVAAIVVAVVALLSLLLPFATLGYYSQSGLDVVSAGVKAGGLGYLTLFYALMPICIIADNLISMAIKKVRRLNAILDAVVLGIMMVIEVISLFISLITGIAGIGYVLYVLLAIVLFVLSIVIAAMGNKQ